MKSKGRFRVVSIVSRFAIGLALSLSVSFGQNQILQTVTPARDFSEAVDRAINNEHMLVQKLKNKRPVIETYIQELKNDSDLGFVPKHDFYFLGKLDISQGIVDDSFLPRRSWRKAVPHLFSSIFTTQYNPAGFADEMFVDEDGFDRSHYLFEFVKQEFLGEVRCLVADVIPAKDAGKHRFKGRIWIEDRNYNVVRYSGLYAPSPAGDYTHFDSWRVNAAGLWLPTYIYSQEEGFNWGLVKTAPMRGQTRLWNYETSKEKAQQAFTEMTVESKEVVRDESATATSGYSPLQSERLWENEAVANVTERLLKAGLLAPAGEVDDVLNTVLNNLAVTNNLNLDPTVRARVLLTTPLESVAIGRTILVSRGLIDVLPDEASLAAVLAHELSHVVLGHSVDTRYAFSDRLLFDDPSTLRELDVRRNEDEEQAADVKAIELLKNSPYKDNLSKVGLFLRMLSERSADVPHLIKPLLGNKVADTKKDLRLSALMDLAPQLQVRNSSQISALPLGSRIVVDPWSDKLQLLRTQNSPAVSAKDKMPFQITPFRVFLTRELPDGSVSSAVQQVSSNKRSAY